MKLTVQYVPVHLIYDVWGRVEGFLSDALEQSGADEYNVDQLKVLVAQGTQELYLAVDGDGKIQGAATVQFTNHPNMRLAFITALGGRFILNRDAWTQFSALLKSHGATNIRAAARESVARLWGRCVPCNEKYTVVEVDL